MTATHPDAPIRFLYRHAVELYLKAFLLHENVPLSRLKAEFGHSTRRLVAGAIELGFQIADHNKRLVEVLDDSLADRYLETGVRRVLTNPQMFELCCYLHTEVGWQIYSAAKFSRPFPTLE